MQRYHDWTTKLRDEIRTHNRPFSYGENDCCTFVCDCILAMTGTDVYADFRGKYHDLKTSLLAMKSVCGSASIEAVAEYVTKQHNMKEVPVLFAQRGDVLLLPVSENPNDLALGIVYFDGINAAVVGEKGLMRIPYHKTAKRAWRVGL